MVVLPTFVTGQPFSASQMNMLSETLRSIKAVADRPKPVFTELSGSFAGYVQHWYNTLQYKTSGSVTLTYNGSSLGSVSGGGTIDLTSLGLTAGQVYPVTMSGAGTLQYLSEIYQPSYSAPPTFVNGTTVTAANLNALVDRTDELIAQANAPAASFPMHSDVLSSWNRDDDSKEVVYRGWFRYTGYTYQFRLYHQAQAYETNQQKSRIYFRINDNQVLRHTSGATLAGAVAVPVVGDGGRSGSNVRGEYLIVEDVYVGSALTVGNIYEIEFEQEGIGTSKSMDLSFELYWMATSTSGAAWSDLPTWAEDGTDISATRLNLYSTAIQRLFPGSGAATPSPMYYDNLVQFAYPHHKRFLTHTKKYAAMVYDGEGTIQAFVNPLGTKGPAYGLPTKAGISWSDLDKIPQFFYGDYYMIDDVDFVAEVDDVSQL